MPTVTLTWTDLNSGALQEDEILVYRDTAPFDADTLPAVLATLPADTETYDDTTVSLSTSYWYAVAMVKEALVEISFTGEVEVGAGGGGDPHFASVVLLCHFDGTDGSTTFTDVTGKTMTAVNNAQIDTAQSKFGGASGYFDGTVDRVWVADSPDWDFDTGPFTIELFVRHETKDNSTVYVTVWDAFASFAFYIEGGQLKWRVFDAGGGLYDLVYNWVPTLGTWYHVAVDRDSGGNTRLYIDGVKVANRTDMNFNFRDSGDVLTIGAIGNSDVFGSFNFQGHMDELRITKGVARYASDAGFTVPTAAYPDD